MNHDELALRQQRLLVRSAQLRRTFADEAQVFKKPMAVADQVRNALRWLRQHPQWPLATLLLVLVLRPKRAMTWGTRLWWAWRTFNRARDWLATLPQRRSSP